MKAVCPHCKQEYPETPDEYLGMTLQCSVCQREFECSMPLEQTVADPEHKTSKLKDVPNKNLVRNLIKYAVFTGVAVAVICVAWYNLPVNKKKRADKEAEVKQIQNTSVANSGETAADGDELKRFDDKAAHKKSEKEVIAEKRDEAIKQKDIQQENEQQYQIYKNSVFGKRELAQNEYDSVVAKSDANIDKIERLIQKKSLTEAEEQELKQARSLQITYYRLIVSSEKDLSAAIRNIVARQRSARRGLLGDERLLALSEEDYEKGRKENEDRIRSLEDKLEKNKKRKKVLEEKQQSAGRLTTKEQKRLDTIEQELKELSRRKNMTRVLFAETDLKKFYQNKRKFDKLMEKETRGRTLTSKEKEELKKLQTMDFTTGQNKIIESMDEFYKSQNGGRSFEELQREERLQREEENKRKIKLDNFGLKKIRYNSQTGKYEAY